MRIFRHKAALAIAVLAVLLAAMTAAPALAVSVTNACKNSVTANQSQINVDTSGTAPASVAAGRRDPAR